MAARSVEFCHHIGIDYVSCSPFRVPLARLAAAQAELRVRQEREEDGGFDEVASLLGDGKIDPIVIEPVAEMVGEK